MPVMSDAALLATGEPDPPHEGAGDCAVSVGASGRGAVIPFAHRGDHPRKENRMYQKCHGFCFGRMIGRC